MTEPARVEIEVDGEWAPLDGAVSMEINHNPEPLVRHMTNVMRCVQEAALLVQQAMVNAAQGLAQLQQATATPPNRRDHRPAWQSPYGPPQKGHRR